MQRKTKKPSQPVNPAVFRSGVWSAALAAAVVVLAILLNLVVQAIPTKYTEFDLSEAGLYTLSDSSKEIARAVDRDVTVYYLCETGSEDAIISKLLDRYAAENGRIHWERKDPAVYPTFAAQYGAQDAENGSLIFVSGEESTVLDASDLYEYDYSDYASSGSPSVKFDGENKITAALYKLSGGEALHAYYTTNHGEQAPTSTLTEALENQNFTVTALDLISSTIPEDCDLLLVSTPQNDFAAAGALVDEMSGLRSYLNRGGKILLTTDSYYSTPNLDALLAEFGLSRTEGLVMEGDPDHSMNGYPYYLLPEYASALESGVLDGINTSRRVLLQMAQGITLTETDGVTAEALLTTTDKAYSKAAGYEMTVADKEDGDLDGPFTLATWAENESTGAQVIWINCGNMDNEGIYQIIPGNVTFLQGCAAALASASAVTLVDSKALEASPISVPSSVAAGLGLTFIILLPAALLAVGAVVVFLRRRR